MAKSDRGEAMFQGRPIGEWEAGAYRERVAWLSQVSFVPDCGHPCHEYTPQTPSLASSCIVYATSFTCIFFRFFRFCCQVICCFFWTLLFYIILLRIYRCLFFFFFFSLFFVGLAIFSPCCRHSLPLYQHVLLIIIWLWHYVSSTCSYHGLEPRQIISYLPLRIFRDF